MPFTNVGSRVGTTIRDLAQTLLRLLDSSLEIQYEPAGQTFVTQRIGSTERARTDLGFEASLDLEQGLRKLIAWWRAKRGQTAKVAG